MGRYNNLHKFYSKEIFFDYSVCNLLKTKSVKNYYGLAMGQACGVIRKPGDNGYGNMIKEVELVVKH